MRAWAAKGREWHAPERSSQEEQQQRQQPALPGNTAAAEALNCCCGFPKASLPACLSRAPRPTGASRECLRRPAARRQPADPLKYTLPAPPIRQSHRQDLAAGRRAPPPPKHRGRAPRRRHRTAMLRSRLPPCHPCCCSCCRWPRAPLAAPLAARDSRRHCCRCRRRRGTPAQGRTRAATCPAPLLSSRIQLRPAAAPLLPEPALLLRRCRNGHAWPPCRCSPGAPAPGASIDVPMGEPSPRPILTGQPAAPAARPAQP